jgi:hypothetical protein
MIYSTFLIGSITLSVARRQGKSPHKPRHARQLRL